LLSQNQPRFGLPGSGDGEWPGPPSWRLEHGPEDRGRYRADPGAVTKHGRYSLAAKLEGRAFGAWSRPAVARWRNSLGNKGGMKLTWAAAGKMRNAARPRAAHKRGQAAGSEGSIAASELRSAEHYGNQRLLFQLCFSEIRSGSTRLQHQPAFRFGTPSLHGA